MKITAKHLAAEGTKTPITLAAGPWREGMGIHPEMIKIRARNGAAFPEAVRQVLAVVNNSDSREDYFEADTIRLVPGHPLYAAARAIVDGGAK